MEVALEGWRKKMSCFDDATAIRGSCKTVSTGYRSPACLGCGPGFHSY